MISNVIQWNKKQSVFWIVYGLCIELGFWVAYAMPIEVLEIIFMIGEFVNE